MKNTEQMVFYQIYPKSFCDSNGDGVGDLRGIISKIDYLKYLGVNAVWITPCFKSPQIDNGYDISNYRDINYDMGSLSDMRELKDRLHSAGIKIILDLVANHTSAEHDWFKESRKGKDNPYRDYYIWRKIPPNDWQSSFGGSAWEFDPATEEYYLHSYAIEQPDLNWENPKVRQEMKAVVDFWLDFGIDGFRCDVLDQISKDWEKNINGNGPRLHEFINYLFGDRYDNIFTVGECWFASGENVSLFCSEERRELTTVFEFSHVNWGKSRFKEMRPALKEICAALVTWQETTQERGIMGTLFFENHDQARVVSRFLNDEEYRFESASMIAGIILSLRGIPFIYQGQEIGVTNSKQSDFKEIADIESVNYYNANKGSMMHDELMGMINRYGRDNGRYMMPWTGDRIKSWITPYSRCDEINAEADMHAQKSVFHAFKKLIALRKTEPCLCAGSFRLILLDEYKFVFERETEEEKITTVCAFQNGAKYEATGLGELLFNNYDDIDTYLKPYQCIIFKKQL